MDIMSSTEIQEVFPENLWVVHNRKKTNPSEYKFNVSIIPTEVEREQSLEQELGNWGWGEIAWQLLYNWESENTQQISAHI